MVTLSLLFTPPPPEEASYFFFSSRRRHTRWTGDWSSDVCSSDLAEGAGLSREPPWQHSPIEEYYSLFEERFEAFERAVRRIAARPHEQLRARQEPARSEERRVGKECRARGAREH